MLVVGLTGGIASGKSAVSKLLQTKHNIPVIDADILAREVVEPGTPAYNKIVRHFGKEVILNDGTAKIDRKKLGDIIFADHDKRNVLNGIVHPAVRKALISSITKCWLRGEPVCVIDVPLLIETGLWRYCGQVVVLYCSRELQQKRLMDRDQIPLSAAQDRLNSQMPLGDKIYYADKVVDNSAGLAELEAQVTTLAITLRSQAGWSWRISWLFPPWGLVSAGLTLARRAIGRTVDQWRGRGRDERKRKAKL